MKLLDLALRVTWPNAAPGLRYQANSR